MAWAYENEVPVTPWGAGTSTEGNPVPTRGGLVVDLTRMNRVLEIRPQDLQADVQPGVLRKELNRQAGRHGLFFPPDPGADATIGGMIANNAFGVQTVKYGATKDYVMRLTVVLPGGRVIHTGCKAPKSSAGFDLTRLFVGSEGTLGIVTEATLKLTGIPSHYLAATIRFPDLEKASQAVALMIGSGLGPAALELLPPGLIRLMNSEKGLGLPEVPSLFCEFHAVSATALKETSLLARELCEECGAVGFSDATEERARKELWRARHEAWETIHRAHPKKETIIVDAAVPISRYPEMVVVSQEEVDRQGAVGYVFGHARGREPARGARGRPRRQGRMGQARGDQPHDRRAGDRRVVNFPTRGIGARTIELVQDAAQASGRSLTQSVGAVCGQGRQQPRRLRRADRRDAQRDAGPHAARGHRARDRAQQPGGLLPRRPRGPGPAREPGRTRQRRRGLRHDRRLRQGRGRLAGRRGTGGGGPRLPMPRAARSCRRSPPS